MYRSQNFLLAYQMVLFNYLKSFTAVKYTISVHTTGARRANGKHVHSADHNR